MATSSIFANFDITDPEKARAFVEALEKSARDLPLRPPRTKRLVSDRKRIKALFKALPGKK